MNDWVRPASFVVGYEPEEVPIYTEYPFRSGSGLGSQVSWMDEAEYAGLTNNPKRRSVRPAVCVNAKLKGVVRRIILYSLSYSDRSPHPFLPPYEFFLR